MTEQTAPLSSEPPPAPPVPPAPPAEPTVRRTFGLPVVGAIAGAALLIGGLAGGIIGYAVHSDGPDDFRQSDFRQGDPGQRFQQGRPGNGQMPQSPNGRLPGGSTGQQQDNGGSDS